MTDLPQLGRGVAITGTDLATITAALAESYAAGATLTELAEITGRSRTWIAEALARAGVSRRSRGRRPNPTRQETT
jgi:hypothetical protein